MMPPRAMHERSRTDRAVASAAPRLPSEVRAPCGGTVASDSKLGLASFPEGNRDVTRRAASAIVFASGSPSANGRAHVVRAIPVTQFVLLRLAENELGHGRDIGGGPTGIQVPEDRLQRALSRGQ